MRLCLRNYERLGTLNYAYEADEITEALMEQLGLLVLGKPNRFKVMSGGVVEDSRRDELRRALGREERAPQRRTRRRRVKAFVGRW